MNFITFPVGTTNIFPMANSTQGGQYATEFNLRSRESVCTPQSVQYMIGPSYVHGEADFRVHQDTASSRSMLIIDPGRAVVNGHYIENLASMEIDMAAARSEDSTLVGKLCIGLRVMYSTLPTMSGSILTTDDNQLYEGIQVVVLPEAQFKLPVDVPTDETAVTAHIKLAEFIYRNSRVSGLINNYPGKCQMIESTRIATDDDSLSDRYLSKTGLNGRNLYVFAGKGAETDDQGNQYDTWCIAQNALMIWDANTQLGYDSHSDNEEAQFVADPISGKVNLYMPHKQLDYEVADTHGRPLYYQPKIISLPVANYTTGTPGTVDLTFINQIKDKFTELGRYQAVPGSQILYIDELHDRSELPNPIPATYLLNPGSFVLVGHDYTVLDPNDVISPPATMYVVQQGQVLSLTYRYSFYSTNPNVSPVLTQELATGIKLAQQTFDADAVTHDTDVGAANDMWNIGNGGVYYGSAGRHDYVIGVTTRETGYTCPSGSYYASSDIADDGVLLVDAYEYNMYVVTGAGMWSWTDPLWITAQIPLATEQAVGGFLNVPETAMDGGYVFRDDTGHLRLLDYDLLRSGTLAYRLSEDVTLTGLTMEALQSELNDLVNQRVAFPTEELMASRAANNQMPNVINITIELADEGTEQTIYLSGIDSRFGTSVYLHITGNATSDTTLVITDCEKLRIDNNIYGSPTINLYRCGLCYDSDVMDKLNIISGLTLWHEPLTNSRADNISIEGLTVMARDPQVITSELDFWSSDDPNDNHYEYAIRSVTFDSNGYMVGASILIRNNSTYNVDPGQSIYVADFALPQGSDLTYPKSRLTKPINITGTFVSAYYDSPDSVYILTTTEFTAVSQTYTAVESGGIIDFEENLGTLSVYSNTIVTSAISGSVGGQAFALGSAIDGWDPSSFHIFDGGITS